MRASRNPGYEVGDQARMVAPKVRRRRDAVCTTKETTNDRSAAEKAHQCRARAREPGSGRLRSRPRDGAAPRRSAVLPYEGLDEMTPDTIITVDLEGRKVSGTMPRHNEVFIHSEVLRARPDVQAVVHTHAPHAVAFSSLGRELVPVSNEAGYFYKKLPVFAETTDLIVTPERGKAVARWLGPHGAAILRNHGIVTTGRTIEEAVWLALKLERACRVQLLAECAGGPKLVAEGEDLENKNRRANRADLHTNVFNYLVRRWACRHCGSSTA